MTGAEVIRFALLPTSLGLALVARSGRGLCALTLGDDADMLRADLARRFPKAERIESGEPPAEVLAFVEGRAALSLPLDLRGTPFQQRVWQALREIPPGATATYAGIARSIGAEKATRAVAAACAANPIAIAVPCHRVIRSDGGLSGYRWGDCRKRALLAREGADCALAEAVA